MTELLTHVLVGFILGTLLSVRFDWINRQFVTVVMFGAMLPDFWQIDLIVPSETIQETFGVPFYWFVLHTPFGTILSISILSLLIDSPYRKRVFGLLLAGATSHFVLDALLINPSIFSSVLFWPVATELLPLPMIIVSSDRWPAAIAICVSILVWAERRYAN